MSSYPTDQGNPAGAIPVYSSAGVASLGTNLAISNSSSGDTTVVTGVASKSVRVYRLVLVFGGTTTITLKDGTTALTGAMTFNAGGSLSLDVGSVPWWVTTAGNGFVINSSAAVSVAGFIQYVQS